MQERRNPSALVMESRISCTKPSISKSNTCKYRIPMNKLCSNLFWKKSVLGTDTFWRRLHTCSLIWTFGWLRDFHFLTQFYTLLLVPLSRPILSLELWSIRPFPLPDSIEDSSIHISSANLNFGWLIKTYPPNQFLVGFILPVNNSPRLAFWGGPNIF